MLKSLNHNELFLAQKFISLQENKINISNKDLETLSSEIIKESFTEDKNIIVYEVSCDFFIDQNKSYGSPHPSSLRISNTYDYFKYLNYFQYKGGDKLELKQYWYDLYAKDLKWYNQLLCIAKLEDLRKSRDNLIIFYSFESSITNSFNSNYYHDNDGNRIYDLLNDDEEVIFEWFNLIGSKPFIVVQQQNQIYQYKERKSNVKKAQKLKQNKFIKILENKSFNELTKFYDENFLH